MRILFLAPFPPSSERPDALNHLRLLARHHEVTLVLLYRRQAELALLDAGSDRVTRIEPLYMSRSDSWLSCAARGFTSWPLYLAYYYNRRLLDAIRRIAHEVQPDVVHAHTLRMAPFAAQLGAPLTVCNTQDVLTTRYASYVRGERSARWPVDLEEWLKLRWYEPALWRRMDRVGVVSEEEAADARQLAPDIEPDVLRPGIDPTYFAPLPDTERNGSLVFLGRFSYRVNVEAALRAARLVFPLVRRDVPNARLVIVGSDPPPVIRELASQPGVEVTGFVPDVRPYLGRAALSLSPMTTAGGVKNKVLQPLAMATPVVTNEWGARGTGLIPGRDLLVGETDEAMAGACVALLKDPARRRRLGEAGRELVVARHGWDALAEALEAFHQPRTPGRGRGRGRE